MTAVHRLCPRWRCRRRGYRASLFNWASCHRYVRLATVRQSLVPARFVPVCCPIDVVVDLSYCSIPSSLVPLAVPPSAANRVRVFAGSRRHCLGVRPSFPHARSSRDPGVRPGGGHPPRPVRGIESACQRGSGFLWRPPSTPVAAAAAVAAPVAGAASGLPPYQAVRLAAVGRRPVGRRDRPRRPRASPSAVARAGTPRGERRRSGDHAGRVPSGPSAAGACAARGGGPPRRA